MGSCLSNGRAKLGPAFRLDLRARPPVSLSTTPNRLPSAWTRQARPRCVLPLKPATFPLGTALAQDNLRSAVIECYHPQQWALVRSVVVASTVGRRLAPFLAALLVTGCLSPSSSVCSAGRI